MLAALRLSARIRHLLKLDSVVVFANNTRGFADKSSRKEKRRSRRYIPRPKKLGDISILYNNNADVGSSPDLVKVCTNHINAYVEGRNLSKAQDLFDLMVTKEVEPNVYTYNILMKGYSRIGNTERVSELFKEMGNKGLEPTEVTFNTAIGSYARNGDLEEAQSFFKKMKDSYGLKPDVYTYSSVLTVCATAKDLETAKNILREMMLSDVQANSFVLSSLIDVYAECCNEENGKDYLEECRELMDDMKGKGIRANIHVYSTLLKLCVRGQLTVDAIKILNEMRSVGMHLNVVPYNTVLDGLSKDYNLSNEEVLELSSNIVNGMKKKAVRPNARIYNSSLNVALRVGDLDRSERLFEEMKTLKVNPDRATYAAMIKCREKLGDSKKGDDYLKPCLDLWHECEKAGLKLTEEGYTSLLSACAKVSNLDQALKIWNGMMEKKVKPDARLYNAMIKACLSKDKEDKAFDFYDQMKGSGIKPNVVTYGTFLSYFEKKKDRAGAERIFDEMKTLGVDPDKSILRIRKTLGFT